MALDLPVLVQRIRLDDSTFEAGAEKIQHRLHGLGSEMSGLQKVGGAAFTALAGSAVAFGVSALKAGIEGERVQIRLKNAVEQSGHPYEQVREEIEKTAKAGEKFGLNNEQVEGSLARLTQILHDPEKAIKALGLAEDVAAARGVDLASVSTLIGKGLTGNTTALVRLGVVTKAQAKELKGADDVANLLAKTFGGAAQAQADTLGGKMAALNAKIHNLREEAGLRLIPTVLAVGSAFTSTFDFFDKHRALALSLATAVGGPLVFAMLAFAKAQAVAFGRYVITQAKELGTAVARLPAFFGGAAAAEGALAGATEAEAAAAGEAAAATNAEATALSRVAAVLGLTEAETAALTAENLGLAASADAAAAGEVAVEAAGTGLLAVGIAAGVLAIAGAFVFWASKASDVEKAMKRLKSGEGAADAVKDFEKVTKAIQDAGPFAEKGSAQWKRDAGRRAKEAVNAFREVAEENLGGAKTLLDELVATRKVDPATAKQLRAVLDEETQKQKDAAAAAKTNAAATAELTGEAGDAAGAIDGVTGALGSEGAAADAAASKTDHFKDALDKTLGRAKDASDAQNGFKDALDGLHDNLVRSEQDTRGLTDAQATLAKAKQDLARVDEGYADQQQDAAFAIREAELRLADVRKKAADQAHESDQTAKERDATIVRLAEARNTAANKNVSQADRDKARAQVQAELDKLRGPLGAAPGLDPAEAARAQLDEEEAVVALERARAAPRQLAIEQDRKRADAKKAVADAEGSVKTALDESSTSFDTNTKKGRENSQAVGEVADQIRRHIELLHDQGHSLQEVRSEFGKDVDALKTTLRQAGLTELAIDALITQYDLIPEQVITAIVSEGLDETLKKVADLKVLLTDPALTKVGRINIGLEIGETLTTGPLGPAETALRDLIPGLFHASGGTVDVRAGGRFSRPTAVVGEGSRSWEEYVIPTDPAHRGSAFNYWAQAGSRIGAFAPKTQDWQPMSAGGGHDDGMLGALLAAVRSLSTGHSVTVEASDPRDGTQIGRDVVWALRGMR